MSLETSVVTVLLTQCPRVSPDVAPLTTAKPYVTYQGFGGQTVRFLDKTPASKRNRLLQVNTWAATLTAALALARAIEDALCASTLFQADPIDEPTDTHEDLALTDAPQGLYGCIQRFNVWADR